MPVSSGSMFFMNAEEIESAKTEAISGDKGAAVKLYKYYTFSSLNPSESESWLKVAAKLGDPASQYNLALLFLKNEDSENAIFWAEAALSSGISEAKEILDEIRK